MEDKTYLKWTDVDLRAKKIARKFVDMGWQKGLGEIRLYGVPRGGIYAALSVATACNGRSLPPVKLTDNPREAHVIIDDIVDTGKTRTEYLLKYPNTPFFALVDKQVEEDAKLGWVVFSWEELQGETGPQHNVVRMLEYIGEDPSREGLKETPERVVRSWDELYSGYKVDDEGIANLLKTFQDGSTDQMVVEKGIPFFSNCEHHLQPFRGVVHIGYIPQGKIVGLSKLARLTEVFARRAQVQERMTQQIAQALHDHLKPQGVGVVVEAEHFCMSCRGVRKPGVMTITSYLEGVFRDGPVRAEFLSLVHNGK